MKGDDKKSENTIEDNRILSFEFFKYFYSSILRAYILKILPPIVEKVPQN